MKISKLFQTILPITIGTLLFILFIFINEKISYNPELESCERYELSTSVYIIYAFIIILVSSLYQIFVGNWILKRGNNKFIQIIINNLGLAFLYTLLLFGAEIFNKKNYDKTFLILLGEMFFLGLSFSFFDWVLNKFKKL